MDVLVAKNINPCPVGHSQVVGIRKNNAPMPIAFGVPVLGTTSQIMYMSYNRPWWACLILYFSFHLVSL
jgi:hypothetical protein